MSSPTYLFANPWFALAVVLWTTPWKGVALWKAARRNSKAWFVVLLVLNTFALLEIIYVFFGEKIDAFFARCRRPASPGGSPAAPKA